MERVYRKATEEAGIVEVPSFTSPHETYRVDAITGECECPRYVHRGYCAKHTVLAEALLKSRARPMRIEREISERVVTELCRRVFSPRREGASDAFTLLCEVIGSRFSTARIVEAARKRHRRAVTVELGRLGA